MVSNEVIHSQNTTLTQYVCNRW